MQIRSLLLSIVFIPLVAFATPGGVGSSLQKGLIGHWPLTGESQITSQNLVTNGSFDTDSIWVKQDSWSISNGEAISDGTQTAGKLFYNRDVEIELGKKYQLQFTIKSISGALSILPSGGSLTNYTTPGTFSQILERVHPTNSEWYIISNIGTTVTIDDVVVKEIQTADTTPYDNHGAIYGATSTTGPNGETDGAMSFDGVDDYISIGDKPLLEAMDAFSISTWIKTLSNETNEGILTKWYTGNVSYSLRTSTSVAGKIDFHTRTSSSITTTSISLINDNNWHHIIGTYDGLTQKLYIDGIEEQSSAQTGIIQNSEESFCIGAFCNEGATAGNFNGEISNTRIYNRALSTTEINQLYTQSSNKIVTQKPSLETGLVGYWPMNEESEMWATLTGDAWQNSNAYGRQAGTSYFTESGNTIDVTSTSGSWAGAGKMFSANIKGKYKVHIKSDILNGNLMPVFHLYNAGARVSYTAAQVPTTSTFSANHGSGFNYGSKSGSSYEAIDIIDLTNAPTFDAIHIGVLSQAGTSSPYLQFKSSDIYLKQLSTGDVTPYDNHGKINGAILTTGPNGETDGAMSFDGDSFSGSVYNDYIRVPDNDMLDLNTEITWSTWLKTEDMLNNSYGDVGQGVFYKKENPYYGSTTMGYSLWQKISQSYFMLVLGDGTNLQYKTLNYGTTLDTYDNEWFLLTISLSTDGTVKFYFNDILKSTQQFATVDITNGLNTSDDLIIGKGDHGTWDGEMSDFRVYNRALSLNEITQLYEKKGKKMGNKMPSLKSGLIGHWPLSGGYTNTSIFNDITPYDNNGTITGTTLTTGINGEASGATNFDGVDDRMLKTSTFTRSQNGAVLYWFKTDQKDRAGGIFTLFENGTSDYLRSYISANNVIDIMVEDDNVKKIQVSWDLDNLGIGWENSWHQVVWSKTGTTINLYIDGVEKTTTVSLNEDFWTAHLSEATTLLLGNAWGYFDGSIADFRFYNRPLSANEVKRLYELR